MKWKKPVELSILPEFSRRVCKKTDDTPINKLKLRMLSFFGGVLKENNRTTMNSSGCTFRTHTHTFDKIILTDIFYILNYLVC